MNKKEMLMQREIYSLQKRYLKQANILATEYKIFIGVLNNRNEPFFESELKMIMDAKRASMIDCISRIEQNKEVIEAIDFKINELDLKMRVAGMDRKKTKKKSKRQKNKEVTKLVKEYLV